MRRRGEDSYLHMKHSVSLPSLVTSPLTMVSTCSCLSSSITSLHSLHPHTSSFTTAPPHSSHFTLPKKLPSSVGSLEEEDRGSREVRVIEREKGGELWHLHLAQEQAKCLVCWNTACRVAVGWRGEWLV